MNLKLLLIYISLYLPVSALAADYHDMSKISSQVRDYLFGLPEIQTNKDTEIKVHSVDRRLKLAKCSELRFSLASGSHLIGKTSIRIICKNPKPWSFYLTASISRYDEIYIANGTLSRGHIIRADDVYKSRKDLAKLPFGYVTRPEDIIGKQLKRHIQAGRVLTPSQLTNPVVIKRGESVSMQKNTSGFSISMKGTAMMNGAIGDTIRVKNSSSKRIVEGTITQAGIVRIDN